MLFFHAAEVICLRIFGYKAFKKSVDYFNWTILRCLNVLGTRFTMTILAPLPEDAPIIFVSNHQSMWDIPPIIWYLRKFSPKFVSKIELGKGLPGISYNLRHGGAALIDRKNPRQAITEMTRFAKYLSATKYSGVIFPEGTRSRNGVPKEFRSKGLEILFKYAPEAYVVPITVNNSWKLQRYGMFPMPLGVHLKHTVHPPLKISDFENSKSCIEAVEKIIKGAVEN